MVLIKEQEYNMCNKLCLFSQILRLDQNIYYIHSMKTLGSEYNHLVVLAHISLLLLFSYVIYHLLCLSSYLTGKLCLYCSSKLPNPIHHHTIACSQTKKEQTAWYGGGGRHEDFFTYRCIKVYGPPMGLLWHTSAILVIYVWGEKRGRKVLKRGD